MAIWRIEACKEEAGYCSNSSIYNLIRDGLWTKPVRLGHRAVGWPDKEIQSICAARIAGMSETEIRSLVSQLHQERSNALITLRSAS